MRLLLLLLVTLSTALPITLEEAKRLALEKHIDAIKSELELKRLEEKIREVKGSVLPSVFLSASFTRWDPNYISSFVPENKYQVRLSLNQAIFDKGVWEALRLARRSKELQRAVIEEVKASLLSEMEKLFWAVLLKKQILEEKKNSLKYWENYFALVKEKYSEGIVPRYEFLRARAQLRQAKADLIRAESDLESSKNSLKSLLGLSGELEVEGSLVPESISLRDPFGVFERNNTTLKVAKETYRLKLAGEGIKRAEYFPKLSAFFNYNLENIIDFQNGQLKEDYRYGYNFGLRFEWTLFDGWKRKAKVMQEKIESQKAKRELEFLKNKLRNELDTLLKKLSGAREELRAREDYLLASEESLKFATQRYAHGVGSQIELLEARRDYENARISYMNAVYTYNSVLADIKRLLGMQTTR